MARHGSQITTLFDAPQPPKAVKLTLRQRTLWDRFIETTKGLNPQKILEMFNSEKDKLLQKRKQGIPLTQDECDFLNKNLRERIKKVLDNFQERMQEEMEIKPTDSPEEMELKLSFGDQIVKWLSDLFIWLTAKVKEIFAKIKEAFEWCVQQVKDLFEYLFSLFK